MYLEENSKLVKFILAKNFIIVFGSSDEFMRLI